jgi:hypothetical protein
MLSSLLPGLRCTLCTLDGEFILTGELDKPFGLAGKIIEESSLSLRNPFIFYIFAFLINNR